MKLGILSDTHWSRIEHVNPRVMHSFRDVEAILHAGDMVDVSILKMLGSFRPTYAVCGNCDSHGIRARLPPKRTIRVDGFTIGIIHGWRRDLAYLKDLAGEFENVDVIVFGHSHAATNMVMDGVLFFNPGSPTYPRSEEPSVGILELGGHPRAYHIAV